MEILGLFFSDQETEIAAVVGKKSTEKILVGTKSERILTKLKTDLRF